MIKQARNSVRYSNFSDFSNDDQPANNNNNINIGFQNGKEFLDGIEMKKKQNDAINKAAKKIERSLSRRNTMTMNIKINENNENQGNNMELFNIEYNKKNELQNNLLLNNTTSFEKNIGDESKYTRITSGLSTRNSKMYHEMEDKVFIALEGKRQNCLRRHWIISLIIIILIIALLYYVFFFKKNT